MVSLNKATFNHVKNQLGKINQQKHLLTPFPVLRLNTYLTSLTAVGLPRGRSVNCNSKRSAVRSTHEMDP